MLTEGAGEVLGASGDHDARGIERYETHGIADLVAPQARVRVQYERIIHADPHSGQGDPLRGRTPVLLGDELEIDTAGRVQQQALIITPVLPGDETLTGGEQLDAVHVPTNERAHAVAIGRIVHTAVHEERKSGEHLPDVALARACEQPLEVHLRPRRYAADQAHVRVHRFGDDGLHLALPVGDGVRGPGRHAVALEVRRHMVGHDAAQPTAGDGPTAIEHGAALQEDHFAIHEGGVAGTGDVGEQGVARRVDVVRHALPGDRYVFRSTGGATGLGQVDGATRPQHVRLPGDHTIEVWSKAFIVMQRHGLGE